MARISMLKADKIEVIKADWGTLRWFAKRSLGNSDYLTLGECVLKPGKSNPKHMHPNCEEVLSVYKGKIRHTVEEGKEIEMSEGDTITIPKDFPHNATNIGDTEAHLIIAFSSADRKTVGE